MLAWRAFPRPFSFARQDVLKCQRNRKFTTIPTHPQFQVRPPSLAGKIWYRRDGTPRSKIKGLLISTIISGGVFLLYAALQNVEEYEAANYILESLIQIQRADLEFSSTNFSDFNSTRHYLEQMCSGRLLSHIPEERVVAFFENVGNLPDGLKDEAHKTLRNLCEEVHQILKESIGQKDEPLQTGWKIVTRMNDGFVRLSELVEDTFDDEFAEVLKAQKVNNQLLKDPSSKGSSGGDYKVVG